jgi:hypothetical protein
LVSRELRPLTASNGEEVAVEATEVDDAEVVVMRRWS